MLGEEERIMGYEGLQVHIYLSSKKLIPYVEVQWLKKAPLFAKIDDIILKLKNHYGTLYTEKSEFLKIITEEASFKLPGELFHCPSLELKGF